MDVAIMGAGIDGLLAAHAVVKTGNKPVIFDNEQDDHTTYGARYLRRDITGITDNIEASYVQTKLNSVDNIDIGDCSEFILDYITKVYGSDAENYAAYPLQEVEDLIEVTDAEPPCFSPHLVQIKLQDLYRDYTQYQWVTPEWYRKTAIRHDFDIIINTLPMTKWCQGSAGGVGNHRFPTSYYWVVEDVQFGPIHKNNIMLNGDHDIPHYLQANLFGDWIVEWPERNKPPYGNPKRIARPLEGVCDCDTRFYNFVNIGQFGLWDHREPLHDSYYKVYDLICKDEPKQLDLGI